jgi:tripartite-type tricarboxylate transporter receptor subunit TctC
VDVTLENVAILAPLIRDGKVRALAVANKTRTPLLPDIPTLAEAGVPDAEANTFLGSSRQPARRRALFAKSTVR